MSFNDYFSNFSSVGGHFVAGRGTIWTILVDKVSLFILIITKTIIKTLFLRRFHNFELH